MSSWIKQFFDKRRKPLMAQFYGYRGLFGLSFLSESSDGNLTIASRHPRWSITWLWSLSWEHNAGRRYIPPKWGMRLRKGEYNLNRYLCFGKFGCLTLKTQESMAKSPGQYGYNARQHKKYLHRWAKIKAKHAYKSEYERIYNRMSK